MSDTRAKLLEAAAATIREQGIAAASTRAIASRADVNQALVFYHFGTVSGLVVAACRHAVEQAVEFYRDRFAQVSTVSGLLQVGRELRQREFANGNVAMMAQIMSGARSDPVLAEVARYSVQLWAFEIEIVLRRVLHGSPIADVADMAGLASAVTASFIGLQLYDSVDAPGAEHALAALEQLGMLVEAVDDLGPVARRAVRTRLRRRRRPGRGAG